MLVLALMLTLVVSAEASAQRRVTGRVTATSGEPVQAASVNVQGTTIGAYTGEDGRFTLNNVPAGAQVIVVRRIGYRRITQPLQATSDQIDVRLEKDVLQLETQVITGTTTTVSSANAANSVATVSGEQLTKAPTPTIENALQGKIPGAVVTTNSGAPGGGAQIQLRGTTSINASASPLYVVDGVLVSNASISNGLNSITQAGGGITSSQDQQVNRIADLNPDDVENIEVLKGASAGAIYGSKASNGVIIITTKRGQAGRANISVAQRVGKFTISRKLGTRCFSSGAEVDAAGYDSTGFGAAPNKCNDYEGQFYGDNPLSYETNVGIRGGSAGTSFYIGGLAKRDNAIQRNSYYQKQSFTGNVSQAIGSRLTVRANNEFVHSLTDRGISGNDNSPVISPGDVISNTPSFFDMRPVNGIYPRNPFLAEGTNIFQTADIVRAPEDVYRYIGSINNTVSAYTSARQTLDFTLLGGVDAYQYNSKIVSPPDLFPESADGLPGTIVVQKVANVSANLNVAGAHKLILDPLTATTSFGLRQERRQSDGVVNQGRNIPAGVTNVNFAVVQAVSEGQFLVKDFGYFAQEEILALDERLLLTGAINSERSSVNGNDKKFYQYPKAAISYRLPFLPPFTDELKLRAAWGRAGNQPPFGFKFTALPISTYDGTLGGRPSTTAGSPDIKPETSTETEFGMDAQLFHGRVATDVTFFTKKVEDLILQASIAPTSGFTTRYVNGGALRNTGAEVGLNITPVQTEQVSWLSRTTFAQVRGLVTRLDVPAFRPPVGSFGSRYGSPWIEQGRSPTTMQVVNDCKALSASGTCSAANRILTYRESAPDFTMGFSNEVNIGRARLYGLLDWRKGGYAVNLTNLYFDGTLLGPDTLVSLQRLKDFGAGKAVYAEPSGFLKLREISVSYELPKSVTSSVLMGAAQSLRLELSGRNLKTWTKYTGYDPEVSNFSNQNVGRFQDVTPYPPSRSFFFSLVANF